MLDPKLKTFRLVFSLIDRDQGKVIVEEYDKKPLFPMVFKYYYHLHPLVESKKDVVEQRVQEDRTLDIFEMTTSTSELVTKTL